MVRKYSKDQTEAILYAKEGLTLSEIGENLQISTDAVRARLRRAGLSGMQLHENDRDHRIRAGNMRPLDAVEYLCDMVDALLDAIEDSDGDKEIERLREDLTKMEFRVLTALYNAKGRLVTPEHLYAVAYYDRDDERSYGTIKVYIAKMRKKLPENWKIVNIFGQGYKLEITK